MKYLLYIIFIFFISACSDSNSIEKEIFPTAFEWILPDESITGTSFIFPLASNPTMTKSRDIDFISPNSLVALIGYKNEIRVYPYQFINQYEAVNDIIAGRKITLTYCPNTKSAIGWNPNFRSNSLTLRASGYLVNNNLILIDEESDTFWSQMLLKSIKGKFAGETIKTFNLIEVPWKVVKNNFPDALVFTNSSIKNSNKSIAKKENIERSELVYGIVDINSNSNNPVSIYKYDDFTKITSLKTMRFAGKNILVVGNKSLPFITSYFNDRDTQFKAVPNEFPIILEDDQNNKWNIFGIAVDGPRKGDQLESPTAYVAFWWAWQDFYSDFNFDQN